METQVKKVSLNQKRYETYIHMAWKKHWSAEEWTIFISDIKHELAAWSNQVLLVKCLLDEALGETFSSEWMLPLIDRTVSCRLITASSVLHVVCEYPCEEQKPSRCRKLILETIVPILDNITIYAREEADSERLANCIIKCTNWLLSCLNMSMTKSGEQHEVLVQTCYETIIILVDSQLNKILLYFSTDAAMKRATIDNLQSAITISQPTKSRDIVKVICQKYFNLEKSLLMMSDVGGKLPVTYQPHCISLMIKKIVLMDCEFDAKRFCGWLAVVNSFFNLSQQDLFKYLTQVSFTAMADTVTLPIEFTRFIAFTYFTLPEIFTDLLLSSDNAVSSKAELVNGLKLFSSHSPILNMVDKFIGANSLVYFLTSLAGSNSGVTILTTEDVNTISQLRKLESPADSNSGKNMLITVAECKQELMNIMETCATKSTGCYVMLEKFLNSFEIHTILSVAHLSSQLANFVLISLQLCDVSAGSATSDSVQMLDVTFCVLASIMHTYGTTAIRRVAQNVNELYLYQWLTQSGNTQSDDDQGKGKQFLTDCSSAEPVFNIKSGKDLCNTLKCINQEFVKGLTEQEQSDMNVSSESTGEDGQSMKVINVIASLPLSATLVLAFAIKDYIDGVEHKRRLVPLTILQQLLDQASTLPSTNRGADIVHLREMVCTIITDIFYKFHPSSSLQVGPKLSALSGGDKLELNVKKLLEGLGACGAAQIESVYVVREFVLGESDVAHLLPVLLHTASTYSRQQEMNTLLNFIIFILTSPSPSPAGDTDRLVKFGHAFLLKLVAADKSKLKQLVFGPGADLLVFTTAILLVYYNWLLTTNHAQPATSSDQASGGNSLALSLNTLLRMKLRDGAGRCCDAVDMEYLSRVLLMMCRNDACKFILKMLDTDMLVDMLKAMLAADSTAADCISTAAIISMFNLADPHSKAACLKVICKYCTRSIGNNKV